MLAPRQEKPLTVLQARTRICSALAQKDQADQEAQTEANAGSGVVRG